MSSPVTHTETSISIKRAKYLDILARFYVMKRQHFQAGHVLYMLAECPSSDGMGIKLEQRCYIVIGDSKIQLNYFEAIAHVLPNN